MTKGASTATSSKFDYQKKINKRVLRAEKRTKAKENRIFEKMEDLLDEESIRLKIEQLENKAKKQSALKLQQTMESALGKPAADNLFGADALATPALTSPTANTRNASHDAPIHRRDDALEDETSKRLKQNFPPIGSFSLISDLVKQYNVLSSN